MILLYKCAECGSDQAVDLPSDPQPGNIRAGIYTHALKSLKLSKQGANESMSRFNPVAALSRAPAARQVL